MGKKKRARAAGVRAPAATGRWLVPAALAVAVLFVVGLWLWQEPEGPRPRQTPVAVGESAPVFTLPAADGAEVDLSAARARGPVVLVFYRTYY